MKYIIITTHGNLLRSYFSFISNLYSKYFNNCCIIKCYINNNILHFKMIFEGYNHDNKNNNFVIQDFNLNNYFIFNYLNINYNTIIYFIRHGQALHNIIKQIDKFFDITYYDPKLTDYGKLQAFNISKLLINDIFYNYNFNINNDEIIYSSSCLLRAIQTNLIIKKNIDKYIKYKNYKIKKQNLYIIPNLNENIYINNYFYNLGFIENIINYFYYTNKLNYNFHIKNNNILYNTNIIWKYYFNYNDNHCNIDILYHIINCLKLYKLL